MPLPTIPLPAATVHGVELRGLSRTEAMHFTTGFTEEALPDVPLGDRGDRAEAWILARATGVTEAEAAEWRTVTPSAIVGEVVDRIILLSGLEEARPGEKAPPDPTNGVSPPASLTPSTSASPKASA
jgi:hypothetical protein